MSARNPTLAPRRMHHGEALSRRAYRARALAANVPALLWLAVFFVAPLLLIGAISFLSRSDLGTVVRPWTWENYRRLAGFGLLGFDPLYPQILLRSLLLGGGTALLCLLAGLPLAFFIAQLRARWQTAALTLVVIPFWTNLLIRTYAWQILLSSESWLTRAAAALRLVAPGEALYPGTLAVFLGMVCDFLPFMVLPLYASVEKIDWSLAEAAVDLGANRWNAYRHGILPQIRSGMLVGLMLVFLPATGQFVIPDLLGGAKTFLLGNAIQQQFGPGLDWPFGAAMTVLSLALVGGGLWLATRRRGESDRELW